MISTFSLKAGSRILDFTNTVDERIGFREGLPPPKEKELLLSYGALLEWCCVTDILTNGARDKLKMLAQEMPHKAEAALATALQFREVIFRVCLDLAMHRKLISEDLINLNKFLEKQPELQLTVEKQVITSHRAVKKDSLLMMVPILVDDAVRLLTTAPLKRLRVCAMPECGWLFLDTSKSGKRRWCDMADCGNIAKARRFYDRQ